MEDVINESLIQKKGLSLAKLLSSQLTNCSHILWFNTAAIVLWLEDQNKIVEKL
jgi:hypothetical protein